MQYASAGALILVGLLLIVLVWQTGDGLAARLDDHCEIIETREPFLSFLPDDDGVTTVPYEAVGNTTPTPIPTPGTPTPTPQPCEIDGGAWPTPAVWPTVLPMTPVRAELVTDSVVVVSWGGAGTHYTLNGTEWVGRPKFVQSRSQMLFERAPALFFGILAFVSIFSLVVHYWFSEEE